jgi:mono/diheme cytochrome c family protein
MKPTPRKRSLGAALSGGALLVAIGALGIGSASAVMRPKVARAEYKEVTASGLESAVAESGRHYYLRYCASCHGWDARGQGAVAIALATKPPDLTLIAGHNGGKFPMDEVAATIDGRKLPPAHGVREMPVWGERFGEEFEGDPAREQVIRGQLLMLLVYLQSIQR